MNRKKREAKLRVINRFFRFSLKHFQELGKSSRRVTLNKKFLGRLADHMTIENPRKSRSQERSENSRRERSPPRESRRRNSSGTDTSRRSRRRSGPAGFSSAAAVTLKEDDKVSKNRVDFRQVDKSRARYMGLCKLLYCNLASTTCLQKTGCWTGFFISEV